MVDYSKAPSEADLEVANDKLMQMELFNETEFVIEEETKVVSKEKPVDYKTHSDNIQNGMDSTLGEPMVKQSNTVKLNNQEVVNRDDPDDGYQIDF